MDDEIVIPILTLSRIHANGSSGIKWDIHSHDGTADWIELVGVLRLALIKMEKDYLSYD